MKYTLKHLVDEVKAKAPNASEEEIKQIINESIHDLTLETTKFNRLSILEDEMTVIKAKIVNVPIFTEEQMKIMTTPYNGGPITPMDLSNNKTKDVIYFDDTNKV